MLSGPTLLAVLGIIAVAVVMIVSAVIYGEESRAARSVIRRFFLTIALPVALTVAVPLIIAGQFITLDVRIWQALIAALVITTGWLTSAIFTEQGLVRRKAERLRDYHKALYAEIGTSVDALWDMGNSDAYADQLIEKMGKDDSFVPFIPREQHDFIYDAIVKEIDVLPRQTIDSIVAYYSQIKAIAALAEDMRSSEFNQLPSDRRILMFIDYNGMRQQAFAYGQHALKLIAAYSSGGSRAADAVSTPGAGQNDPSQGSA